MKVIDHDLNYIKNSLHITYSTTLYYFNIKLENIHTKGLIKEGK